VGAKLKLLSRKRMVGLGASWIAAYTLVLNVMLSSMLLASMSPAAMAASMELCVNNPDVVAAQKDADKSNGKAAVHCPICVGNHIAGTPPPAGPSFVARVAVTTAQIPAPATDVTPRALTSGNRARAPPGLI
jgi:hypothetical protein